MKILIAHRGNITGPNPEKENHFDYLMHAVIEGYCVEVDVWKLGDKWFFGHDEPNIPTTKKHIEGLSMYAWFHAKNKRAFFELSNDGYHTFEHLQEPYAFTSKGYKWSHKGIVNPTGVVCMPDLETERHLIRNCGGICHDYLDKVEEILRSGA